MMLKMTNQTGLLPMHASVETNILSLCRKIRIEATLIAAVGFPEDMRDLFIEQGTMTAMTSE